MVRPECRQWYLILGQVPIGTIWNFVVPIGTLIFLKVLNFPKFIKTTHQKLSILSSKVTSATENVKVGASQES